MKTKLKTVLITGNISLILILIFAMYRFVNVGESYRTSLSNSYSKSIGDFTEYLSQMETALEKTPYISTTTGQSAVATLLCETSTGAKCSMSYLPFDEDNSSIISEILSNAMDFSKYLENKSAKGIDFDKKDLEMSQNLLKQINSLVVGFSNIRTDTNLKNLNIGQLDGVINQSLVLSSSINFDYDIKTLTDELALMPTTSAETHDSLFLKDKEEITEDQALKIAQDFAKTQDLTLKFTDEGSLSAFQFSGGDISIKITKIGGEISYFKKSVDIDQSNLLYEEALEKSFQHLKRAGYENMTETYYVINDNSCTINFCPVQDDVILYPDTVTVTVELNEGDILEFSATNYLMNHRKRDNLSPKIDLETAKKSLNENLTVTENRLALIEVIGGSEELCYEFICKEENSKDSIGIYINASTGLEEQIYIISENENGQILR